MHVFLRYQYITGPINNNFAYFTHSFSRQKRSFPIGLTILVAPLDAGNKAIFVGRNHFLTSDRRKGLASREVVSFYSCNKPSRIFLSHEFRIFITNAVRFNIYYKSCCRHDFQSEPRAWSSSALDSSKYIFKSIPCSGFSLLKIIFFHTGKIFARWEFIFHLRSHFYSP